MITSHQSARPGARSPVTSSRSLALGLAAIAPSIIASALGGLATTAAIPDWYTTIVRPWYTPPNWVFGPVWTVLYALLAWSFWRILRLPPGLAGRGTAIVLFLAQMAVNLGWSLAFFGGRSPEAGLVVIVVLIALIVATMMSFLRLDRVAGLVFIPYLAWVSYATLLNIGIVWLN